MDNKQNRAMVNHWANRLSNRKTILEFWEWLIDQTCDDTRVFDINIEKMCDDFHGINHQRLERERREILESHNRDPVK